MHLPNVISIVFATYWTILVVELIGDKAIYTITSLASRYSPLRVYTGITVAFMGKMLAAVLFAQLLLRVPVKISAGVGATVLFVTAAALWMKTSGPSSSEQMIGEGSSFSSNGCVIAFAAIFLSEWGDVGQLTTAALSAQYRMPLAIWMGATAALMTKGLLALTVGMQLRRLVPNRVLKIAAVGSCCVLGAIAIRTVFVG
jgi:putative Ca2+/H+ antiporter (TMEM165/GDT1 family)